MRRGPIGIGNVDFGDFRHVEPVSDKWGFDRGQPIDRYYIERFLQAHASDIRGEVLEIGDNKYTRMFGGPNVSRSAVLNLNEDDHHSTFVADLTAAPQIPSNSFDCLLVTQTLQLIFDLPAAVRTLHRILRPGGVLLATFPGITHTHDRKWSSSWCWSLTRVSASRLFGDAFSSDALKIAGYGNVLAATAFLQGLAAAELAQEELDYSDPGYDVTISLRAFKADVGS